MRLEIGPSKEWGSLGEDWQTLDIEKREGIDIVHDITKTLPLSDNTFDLVYMSHVLGYIHWSKTIDVLKEVYRILKPNGIVEIWVPDLDKIAFATFRYSLVPPSERCITQFEWINQRLYTDTDLGSGYKAAFNSEILAGCLSEAGFRELMFLQTPRGPHPTYHGWANLGVKGTK